MPITSDEAFRLSLAFRELAESLSEWLRAGGRTITLDERREVEAAAWQLRRAASDMLTQAVGLALDEAEADLVRLEAVTAEAKGALQRLDSVRATIEVATAAVSLAQAIATQNAGGVGRSLKTLYETIPRAATGPGTPPDRYGA